MADIEEFLRAREESGLLRVLKPISLRKAGRIYIGKREYIDFSSNDYLGLSSHPRLIEESKKAVEEFGSGASGSRLMSGDSELCHLLEEKVAQFKNKESAIVFNSGYQANSGIISALYGRNDVIFLDRFSHASIVDGVVLSRAKFFRFHHNDPQNLEELLKKERIKSHKALIVTESVFSMDGDKAPLKDLVRLKEKYDCTVMVDEAHATGIFGKRGSGMVEEEGLEKEIELVMGTFSKALGSFGAYLATSRKTVEYLINVCRSFIYSTALPPSAIASSLAGLSLIEEEPQRRKKLLESARYFREALQKKGLQVKGDSQIVPVITGENFKTKRFAERLQEKGYWVLPIRPPTVPEGEGRLRFSLNLNHDKEILERLIDDICDAGI